MPQRRWQAHIGRWGSSSSFQLKSSDRSCSEYRGLAQSDGYEKRLEEIQPEALLTAEDCNFTEQTSERLLALQPDFIIDAIDSMADKLCLIVKCHQKGLSIISATGAGNRMDLQQLKLADVFDTQGDPVCRILRRELRKQGVERHMVVYSQETPMRKGRPTEV